MTATPARRLPPPPLEAVCPDCPICDHGTRYEDDGYACDNCQCWWSERLDGPGEWYDPEAAQCAATVQPHLDNSYITDPVLKARTYRCVLDAEHNSDDPVVHAAPDLMVFAKGWR